MGTLPINKAGGLALIIGPILALVFFLIQPGGLLVDSADVTDAAGSITALTANTTLANLSAILIILGLGLTIYGLYVINSRVSASGNGKAMSQKGFLMIFLGLTAWILSQGTVIVLADANSPGAVAGMAPVYAVKSALLYVGGLLASAGFISISLALSTRSDENRPIALFITLVSIVALVFYIIAISLNSQTDMAVMVARICYIPWVLWSAMLGFNLLSDRGMVSSR